MHKLVNDHELGGWYVQPFDELRVVANDDHVGPSRVTIPVFDELGLQQSRCKEHQLLDLDETGARRLEDSQLVSTFHGK